VSEKEKNGRFCSISSFTKRKKKNGIVKVVCIVRHRQIKNVAV
jgi:hypothetical protein